MQQLDLDGPDVAAAVAARLVTLLNWPRSLPVSDSRGQVVELGALPEQSIPQLMHPYRLSSLLVFLRSLLNLLISTALTTTLAPTPPKDEKLFIRSVSFRAFEAWPGLSS